MADTKYSEEYTTYLPSEEKLIGLGFEITTSYPSGEWAECERVRLGIAQQLQNPGGHISAYDYQVGVPNEYSTRALVISCPTEEFFDQLIVAIWS